MGSPQPSSHRSRPPRSPLPLPLGHVRPEFPSPGATLGSGESARWRSSKPPRGKQRACLPGPGITVPAPPVLAASSDPRPPTALPPPNGPHSGLWQFPQGCTSHERVTSLESAQDRAIFLLLSLAGIRKLLSLRARGDPRHLGAQSPGCTDEHTEA